MVFIRKNQSGVSHLNIIKFEYKKALICILIKNVTYTDNIIHRIFQTNGYMNGYLHDC